MSVCTRYWLFLNNSFPLTERRSSIFIPEFWFITWSSTWLILHTNTQTQFKQSVTHMNMSAHRHTFYLQQFTERERPYTFQPPEGTKAPLTTANQTHVMWNCTLWGCVHVSVTSSPSSRTTGVSSRTMEKSLMTQGFSLRTSESSSRTTTHWFHCNILEYTATSRKTLTNSWTTETFAKNTVASLRTQGGGGGFL